MTLSIADTAKISTSTKTELAKIFPNPDNDCHKITQQLKTLTGLKYDATLSLTKEQDPVKRVQLLSTVEFSSSLLAERQRRKTEFGCQDISVTEPKKAMFQNSYIKYIAIGLTVISLLFFVFKKKK
jgi:hypothetical protein